MVKLSVYISLALFAGIIKESEYNDPQNKSYQQFKKDVDILHTFTFYFESKYAAK
jgi:hypothetical protein